MMSFKVETMIFTNPTNLTIKLDALGMDPVGPGQDVELPLQYCAPKRTDNGQRGKSPVESVAPQLRPKSDEDHKAWLEVPTPVTPQSRIVSVSARPVQEAPGVKSLRERAEAQKAAKATATANAAPKATASPLANVSASSVKA